MLQVAASMLRRAICAPTKADEHAVSTATEGPLKPKVYDTRPGATLAAEPVQQHDLALNRSQLQTACCIRDSCIIAAVRCTQTSI